MRISRNFCHCNTQWGRNEIFLGVDLFNKKFWNYKFLAKFISTIQKFRGVTSLRFSPVPPSLSIIKINNFESPLIISTQIRLRALKKYILNAFKKELVHTFILDVHHKWFLIRRLSTTYHLVDGMTGIIPHFSHIDSQNRSCIIGKRLPFMALDNLDHKLHL